MLVLSVIGTLGTFDEIYVMTSGGPGTATSVPAYLVWRRMFLTGQVGSAAALGIVLMLDRVRGDLRAQPAHGAGAEGVNTASRTQVTLNYLLISPVLAGRRVPARGRLPGEPVPAGARDRPVGIRAPADASTGTTTSTAWEQGKFAASFTTSIVVAAVMVPASVVLSILGGLRVRDDALPRHRRSIFYLFILGLIIPTEATIVPLYYDVRAMGLLDTYWALILLEISGELAFGIFWMRAAFLSAPRSLLEAARIDGASSWRTLWRMHGAVRPAGDPDA